MLKQICVCFLLPAGFKGNLSLCMFSFCQGAEKQVEVDHFLGSPCKWQGILEKLSLKKYTHLSPAGALYAAQKVEF